MTKKFVYLAGPITGCNIGEANDWRRFVADKLVEHNIIGISPLRCEPLIGDVYTASNPDPRFGTARAIASKNMFDVRNCDMTFAYLPTPEEGRTQSLGTIIETAWAHALGKLVIVVTDDKTLIDHPVLNLNAGWLLPTLEDGVDVVLGVLGGYSGGKNV